MDSGNSNRTSRFANYLRNMHPCNDVGVMVMRARAVGRLAQVGGIFSADYVEFEVKRALECLDGDRNEGRRHDAVSLQIGKKLLNLLCICTLCKCVRIFCILILYFIGFLSLSQNVLNYKCMAYFMLLLGYSDTLFI